MPQLPLTSFLQSHTARVELARRRYFEEGQVPTGVVSDAVFESWSRCLRLHQRPRETAVFQPVSASRTQLALHKSGHLHRAWLDEMPRLELVLGTTTCAAMLTDATGVIIGAACVGRAHEKLMVDATRMGVNLSEDAVGTTAPGVAARTGKPVRVLGGEHFFENVKDMHCAAAPIHDIGGGLAGVLDISSEFIPFAFDAAALVGLYAAVIENRLLLAQSTDHLVIRFQVTPDLLGSELVGLVGIDASGRVAWQNGVARRLLGVGAAADGASAPEAERVLGSGWQKLASLPGAGEAMLTLASGLLVWARADMQARDGLRHFVAMPSKPEGPDLTSAPAEVQEPVTPTMAVTVDSSGPDAVLDDPGERPAPRKSTPATLRDSDLELIKQTVEACGGNVSEAARRLGVSRGLVYRHLRR